MSEVAQLRPTLCNPMDCSLPGSSVHGILQARILEWAAISFSRGSSQPRDGNGVSCIVGRRFTIWATREAQWLFRPWYLTDIFLKINSVSLSLQREWLTILLSVIKSELSVENQNFGKLVCYHRLDNFPILKGFLMRLEKIANVFLCYYCTIYQS